MARKSRKLNQSNANITIQTAKTFPVCVYARISVEGSHSEDSIDNQIAICKEYIGSNNELLFRNVFTDLGYSGTNFDRPGYVDMMAGILCGDVKCVVVKDLSRLGRTYIEVGELLFDTFVQYGVRFISVNDNYDSFADDAGRKKLLILFKNLVNHMYSKDLGKKIRASFVTKQKNGELLGSMPPYGYIFSDDGKKKCLKIEPKAAEIVKTIFDMRIQGLSTIKITEHLNTNNIPTPGLHYYQIGVLTHKKYDVRSAWQNSFICKLLANEVYTGCQVQSKYDRQGKKYVVKPESEWIIHKDTHEAIIDEAQFKAVQELVSEASNKYKKHGNSLDENIFVGKVFCSRCGKSAKREYYRGKNVIKYSYHCRYCDAELRREMGVKEIKPIKMEQLENVVSGTIRNHIDICLNIEEQLEDISCSSAITDKRHILKNERDKYTIASKKADEMLASAYKHHLNEVLNKNEFELARAKFETDKQTAEIKLAQAEQRLSEYNLNELQKNECLTNFRTHSGFDVLNREIITTLVHRIDITPFSNEIDITLNFRNSFAKLENLCNESEVIVNVW